MVALGCSRPRGRFEPAHFALGESVTAINCLVYLPPQYAEESGPWPLVLFLHGAGECGDDLDKVKEHGLPKLAESGRDFPFLIVAPQSPQRGWETVALLQLLDSVAARYRIDPDRVCVTGLSMGGYGTWALAASCPERFAAAVPICGGGDLAWAEPLKSLPVWAFHGAKDDVVPLSESQEMVRALEAVGANVRLTVYPEADHECWKQAYDEPELYRWLARQKRRSIHPSALRKPLGGPTCASPIAEHGRSLRRLSLSSWSECWGRWPSRDWA